MICYYWFCNRGFKFRDPVCNGSHDLTMLSVNIRDIAIFTIKNVDYSYIVHNFICLSIYKLVDSTYSMDTYKFVKINIGTVKEIQKC